MVEAKGLKKIEDSKMHQMSQKEKAVIALSDDEHNAMNKIKEKSTKINKYKQDITDTITSLNKNKISTKSEIDKQSNIIINAGQRNLGHFKDLQTSFGKWTSFTSLIVYRGLSLRYLMYNIFPPKTSFGKF